MRGGGLSSSSIGCVLLVLESGFKGLSEVSPCFSQGRVSPSSSPSARFPGVQGRSRGAATCFSVCDV